MKVTLVWPFRAKKQLHKELSGVLNNLSALYIQTVSSFLHEDINSEKLKNYEKLESEIQISILHCEELLTLAIDEPSLKKSLPEDLYKKIIKVKYSLYLFYYLI